MFHHVLAAPRKLATPAILSLSLLVVATARADDLPDAKIILDNAVKAQLGSAKAIANVKSLHTVSEMDMGGMKLVTDVHQTVGGSIHMKLQAGPMGTMEYGYDGTVGWTNNPMMGGYKLLSEAEIEQLRDQVEFQLELLAINKDPEEKYRALETVSVEMVDDRECYKVRVAEKSDPQDADSWFFFDKKTGMPVGGEMMDPQSAGVMRLADWTEVEGVKFFQTMVMSQTKPMPREFSMTVSTIEVNKVDDAVFALPDEVKQLVEAAKKPQPTTRPAQPTPAGAGEEISLEDLTPDQQREAQQLLVIVNMMPDEQKLEETLNKFESSLDQTPAEKKKTMEYVIQEGRKRLKGMRDK